MFLFKSLISYSYGSNPPLKNFMPHLLAYYTVLASACLLYCIKIASMMEPYPTRGMPNKPT